MKINFHGLASIVGVIAMLIFSLIKGQASSLIYVILAVVLYIGTVFYITRQREEQADDHRLIVSKSTQLLQTRILYGAHIAIVLLVIGLLLPLNNLLLELTYFVVAIIAAMIIPFIVITRSDAKTKFE